MYLAVDVGGTKTLVAVFSDSGQIMQEAKFATPKDYPEFLSGLAAQIKSFGQHSYDAAAIAVPNTSMDHRTGVVSGYGNLPWGQTAVQADIQKIVNCPVVVENDAKAGGLSEALDVINEYKKVLFVTVVTGIGYAYIVNGVIDHNEPDIGGHGIMIDHNGRPEIWESFASGSAIFKEYGLKASQISDPAAWQAISKNLAVGINSLLERLPTEVVIVGGGVATNYQKFADYLAKDLRQPAPTLRPAVHAEEAVIYGCYHLAKGAHEKTTS
jgi:predicted NBD/HSP70 family sugar kinase